SYEECYIKQTVTLPNTPKVYMKLYYQDRAFTGAECAGLWVGARIRVAVAGQIILDQYQCYYNTVNVWTYVYFDLSAAAGQTVEIIFQADAASTMWSYLYLDDISISSSLTGIEENTSLPSEFKLEQNYPNPFNPETTISYTIPSNLPDGKAGVKSETINVTLKVYDVLGREVATLVDEYKQPGSYNCKWRIENGEFPSGVYFYQLRAGDYLETKKCTLMK
ncbi:MAG: T9SS type A sorting domain-containing protein, partial [Ignavibacteria bacterium]|nr:T9SS type A sorting domain-containing protein [Ignavibacteria bacterium]